MRRHSLPEVADDQIRRARADESGISGFKLYDTDTPVQHSIVAMTAGQRIEVNHGPQYATAHVVAGAISMRTAQGLADGAPGDFFVVSGEPHSVTSLNDSVLLLTVTPS